MLKDGLLVEFHMVCGFLVAVFCTPQSATLFQNAAPGSVGPGREHRGSSGHT